MSKMSTITGDEVRGLFTRPPEERAAAGRAQRDEVPTEAHAELPTRDEARDPVGTLIEQDAGRQPDLVPIRHGRMSVSPFTFYRGAAAVMAGDLSRTPTTALRVQLCGDAHLSNFGLFNSPDRRLVFDVNDFDETAPGPFEWDVKRLAASVTVAGRDNEISPKKVARATRASVRGYRETLLRIARESPLDLHYYRLEIDQLVEAMDQPSKRSERALAKAARKTSTRAYRKLTDVVDGKRVIVPEPPRVTRIDDVVDDLDRERLIRFFDDYVASLPLSRRILFEHYRYVDMAHKVVGVGSVGTRCLIVLLESGAGDPLFLQVKEATRSVLEPYTGDAGYGQAGERVVRGQQLMQATSDVLLGWTRWVNRHGYEFDFYVRQLWDGKGSAEIADMGGGRLTRYASFCGSALALAHARAGDPAFLSGYVGDADDESIDHAIAEFAQGYADLTERDHTAHLAAIDSGRVSAVRDR